MKSLRMVFSRSKWIQLFLLSFLLACKNDKEVDLREPAIGTYLYQVQITYIADNFVWTDNGVLEISLKGSEELSVVFDKGTVNEFSLTAVGLTPTNSGFMFNVKSKFDFDRDGDQFKITGIEGSNYQGQAYHGKFDVNGKQVTLEIEIDYLDPYFDDWDANIEFLGTKLSS